MKTNATNAGAETVTIIRANSYADITAPEKWITEETAAAAAVDRMEEITEGGGFVLRVMKRPA